MIFITLGSQKFQFNRLLKAVDQQVADGKITTPIFAQIGASDYIPVNYPFKNYVDRDEYSKRMEQADIIITHGGTGAIISALKKGKKVIAVPRLNEYGEHVDNHQIQLINEFTEMNLIHGCMDCDDLWKAIDEVMDREFRSYKSNTNRIIESIDKFIGE